MYNISVYIVFECPNYSTATILQIYSKVEFAIKAVEEYLLKNPQPYDRNDEYFGYPSWVDKNGNQIFILTKDVLGEDGIL